MIVKNKYLVILIFIGLAITSCHDETLSPVKEQPLAINGGNLGKKLENPFSVENMKQAMQSLSGKKENAMAKIPINTTHYYIRYAPQDSIDLRALQDANTDLDYYPYPLDYENTFTGEIDYRDPSLPADVPTYQYTVVEYGKPYPTNVPFTILDHLYLPEDAGLNTLNSTSFVIDPCMEGMLVNESMALTGNIAYSYPLPDCDEDGPPSDDEPPHGGSGGSGGPPCYNCPYGQILVENQQNGAFSHNGKKFDGVVGVKVRARKWFKIKHAYTDENGNFEIIHSFGGNGKVNYSVKYKNKRAYIKPNEISFAAQLNGPKINGEWKYYSTVGFNSYTWGTIMNAVHDYHYVLAPTYGIGRPPNNLKIRANNDLVTGDALTGMFHQSFSIPGTYGGLLFTDIWMGDKNKTYRENYKTAIHELGHAAHWDHMGEADFLGNNINMVLSSKFVREAWATGIAEIGHKDKFDGLSWYKDCTKNEKLRLETMIDDKYLRVFVRDLRDDDNQFNLAYLNCNVVDNVEGYTLQEIWNSLEGVGQSGLDPWDKWEENLRLIRPGQASNLSAYFNQFN